MRPWGQDRDEITLTASDKADLRISLWEGIGYRIKEYRRQSEPATQHRRWIQWAAAAAVVIGCGIGALLLRPDTLPVAFTPVTKEQPVAWVTHQNNTAKPARITLQDGSVVQLWPASTLRYPKDFLPAERHVELEGEGFFEVSHDAARPFRVFTDKVVTTVLGTSFTVRAYAGKQEAQVVVRTGRVRVTARQAYEHPDASTNTSVVLMPSQQVVYSAAPIAAARPLVVEPAPCT